MEWFITLGPVMQATLAGLFTWGTTALGASAIIFFKDFNQKILNGMLGFAAGVMIAASFWSLLAPAIEMAESGPWPVWLPPAIGFFFGAMLLYAMNKTLPHFYQPSDKHTNDEVVTGVKTSRHRSILLISAITLHNIPEGLAIGVAFGAAYLGLESASVAGAIALAVGIGIQNFPEGMAVSVPLRREGFTRARSFMYGQFSGIVEPASAALGAALVVLFTPILPYALSFAAGAMIFVVIEELIPESHRGTDTQLSTIGGILGFMVMMMLDVGLG